MRSFPKVGVAVQCLGVIAVAWYLIAFGCAILCCSVVLRDQFRWIAEKVVYGGLPVVAGLAAWAMAARWLSSAYRLRTAILAGLAISLLAAFLDLVLFTAMRRSGDDGIDREWNPETGVFNWRKGEVKIAPGFRAERITGIDTLMGQFVSADGRVTITYDIGELAGEHGGTGRRETVVQGARVRTGEATRTDDSGRTLYFFKVSFPDSGCANFYLESTDARDRRAIDEIAAGFRPKASVLSWISPILPEIWRSDCRYRFQPPKALLKALDLVL
jgi:hypothetical protein